MDAIIRSCPNCRAVNIGVQTHCLRCGADLSTAVRLTAPLRRSTASQPAQTPGPARPPAAVPVQPRPSAPPTQPACPGCGKAILPGQRFCPRCGTPLYAEKPGKTPAPQAACRRCGKVPLPGELFCSHCGAPLQAPAPVGVSPAVIAGPPVANAAPPRDTANAVPPIGRQTGPPVVPPPPRHTASAAPAAAEPAAPQVFTPPPMPQPPAGQAYPVAYPAPPPMTPSAAPAGFPAPRPVPRYRTCLWILAGLAVLVVAVAALAYFGLFVFNPFKMLASNPQNTTVPAPIAVAPASPGIPEGVLYGFYQGDGREGSDTLWIANANTAYAAPPQNVTIGTCGVTTRVNELITMDRPGQCIWAEVTTAETSAGVQFYGSSVKSEVRVLIDEQVYWTGSIAGPNADTTAVPFHKFFVAWQLPSAPHTIKVEYLSGPTVTVRFFGFDYQ